MKTSKLLKLFLLAVGILVLFMLVLPALFSAANTLAVFLGCLVVLSLLAYGLVKVNNWLKGKLNENS